jgi:hypothetical protein
MTTTRHVVTYYDDNGDEVQLPGRWAICHRCRGEGHHGNPAFDGTTTEWWLEGDPDGDDLADYIAGRYDVRCEAGCDNGKLVVLDEERCGASQVVAYQEWLAEEADYRALVAAERRFGC